MRCLMLFLTMLWFKSFSQPVTPILRIETGMHTGQAKRIDTDASGKTILTCSVDKTARLWDASNGSLIRTFRIPISNTDEGTLYACALNNEGTIAAVAGITGAEWSNSYAVYLFNTATGEMIHRISGIPSNIFDLEFSPDGKSLIAACTLNNGVIIYDTKDWSKKKVLKDYLTEVYNVAFSTDGKLSTICWDGKLRLYDKNFEQTGIINLTGGKQPMGISFDPTGKLLSIGYYDSNNIEVFSVAELKLLYKPVVENKDFDGSLFSVAFGDVGNTFYAGGTFNTTDDDGYLYTVIRKWKQNGKGVWEDIKFRNSIQDIKPLPGGRLAVLGSYPEIAVLDANGKRIWEQVATLNDFTAPTVEHFRINERGDIIGCTPLQNVAITFDVNKRQMVKAASNFPYPTEKKGSIAVTDWNQMPLPSINNKPIDFFEQYETNLSVDINSNGKEVILGTEWNLYKTSAEGKLIWKMPLPDFAWLVNISGDDKVVTAAIADGTIRWYSMEDGKELLSLYFSNDYKHWILFTPTGYYDASPGSEEILGWHINQGKDKSAAFFPISRFREQFFRPDIIDLVLQVHDEQKAIALANEKKPVINTLVNIQQKLPPTISILFPANGISTENDMIELEYLVNTADHSPVTAIKVLVNGRPVSIERGVTIKPGKEKTKIKVNIPHEDCTVTMLAENQNGLSPEANIKVLYKKKQPATAATKPDVYVLVIGISNYNDKTLQLGLPAKDATDFASVIKDQEGKTYGRISVQALLNTEATKANILDAFDWLSGKALNKDDVVMIYFAGHGINDNNNVYYMLPHDANLEKLRSSSVNFEELRQTISGIKAKVLVFLDACHSGNINGNNFHINGLVNMLSGSGTGAVTFTSSTGKEVSYEKTEWNNGAFTKALLEGLKGKARVNGKDKITFKSLDLYISERVPELTDNKQHPTTVPAPNLPDFIIINF
jgi:WD40 repeat protein